MRITRRAALKGTAGVPSDPIMSQLHQIEGIHVDAEANETAWRTAHETIPEALRWSPETRTAPEATRAKLRRVMDASGCTEIEAALEAISDRLGNAQVQLFATQATTHEGVLGKMREAFWIMADTDERPADGPNLETAGPLDDGPMFWSIIQDLERLAGEG